MADLELTLVAEGLKFPEGPVAMKDGSVVLTEIEGKRVLRVTPNGEIKVVAETDGGPNGLAVGPDNALYLTNNGASFQFFARGGVNVPTLEATGPMVSSKGRRWGIGLIHRGMDASAGDRDRAP